MLAATRRTLVTSTSPPCRTSTVWWSAPQPGTQVPTLRGVAPAGTTFWTTSEARQPNHSLFENSHIESQLITTTDSADRKPYAKEDTELIANDCTGLEMNGTPVAVFGLGDSVSYGDNFAGLSSSFSALVIAFLVSLLNAYLHAMPCSWAIF